MFKRFRAAGFAAATLVLSASGIGVGHTQVLNQPVLASVPSIPNSAPLTLAPSEPLQVAVPVQSETTNALDMTVPEATPVAPLVPVEPAAPSAPALPKGASLAQLVAAHRSSAVASRELECLAGAIYFESKGEPLPGQVAVGQVIANRAKSGRFPSSYCGVVFQRSQFSFVRGRALPPIPRSSMNWKTAVAVAQIVDGQLHEAVAPKALFFHARHVSPNWKRMSRVATVGNNVFYR